MWVVRSNFGDLTTETERVLGCGESYEISRKDHGGRELFYDDKDLKALSKSHAFIKVGPAPAEGAHISCDWRPSLELLPPKPRENREPKRMQVLRPKVRDGDEAADGEQGGSTGDGQVARKDGLQKFLVPKDSAFELFDGDTIDLVKGISIKVKWLPLSFCVTPKTAEGTDRFAETIKEAAGVGIPVFISADWQPAATHLVIKRVQLRPNVVDALHAPATFVNSHFLKQIVEAAVKAEAHRGEFSPILETMDPQKPEYQPTPPEVEGVDPDELLDKMRDAFRVRQRDRPLVGRSVLCFVANENEEARKINENVPEVLECLGAVVKTHSLKDKPIRNKAAALEVISAFKADASTAAAAQPPGIRRHVAQDQTTIIYYLGDQESLGPIGAAAKEKKCPMPRVVGGDLEWIAYGMREAVALLAPFSGRTEDYVDLTPSTQQQAEGSASPERGEEVPARRDDAPEIHAAAREGAADEEHDVDQDQINEDADGQERAVSADKDASKSAKIMSLQRMQQRAASRKKEMYDFEGDSQPRPAVRSKAAQRRAAETQAAKTRDTARTETGTASEASAGPSRSTSAGKKRPLVDLEDMFGDISADGQSMPEGNSAGSKRSMPESAIRQLRAALDEEVRTQAARATQLEAMGLAAGGSLLTQAIPESDGEEEEEEARSQGALTPLVAMDTSGPPESQNAARRGGRKRTATLSPDRGDDTSGRGTKRRKRAADEADKEGGGEENAGGDKQQPEGQAKAKAAESRVVRGHKHKDSGKGPDKDEQFLRAVSTIAKRKKADPFDKEFDQLRIAKPVYNSAGRRIRSEAEMGSGKGGVRVVRAARTGGGQTKSTDAQDDEVDEEFELFKEMPDDDLDWNLRGNFMQVDIVPLVVEKSDTAPYRIEPDGRPNFKAFRRKGQARKVVDPVRVVSTVLDDLPQLQIGEDSIIDMAPKRTTYGGADDEELEEDDADFTGLQPQPRTYSGHRAKTVNRFQISLGDDENPRADSASQREEPAQSGTGRRGRSQAAPAASVRGRAGGRGRGATQYVEVPDEEEESDPEADLLLNLDDEEFLDEEDQAPETQFSLDSYSAGPSKRGKKATTGARGGKNALPAWTATSAAEGDSNGDDRRRRAPATRGNISTQSSQLFRGNSESLDPLAEQPSTLASGSVAGSSANGPPGSVVPASRPMDSHDEDTFMGFGASGRRRRTGATGGTAGSAVSGTSASRNAAGRARSRF
ncbi:hypothetical protein CF327_g2813 [Tilletia walkeri]|nr:hypothetical protein CF327_g2813 [Tilletia walkeri]